MVAEPSFLHTYPSHPAPNSYPPYQSPTPYISYPPYQPPMHFQDPHVHHLSYNQLWKQPNPNTHTWNQNPWIDQGNVRKPEGIGVLQDPSSNQPWNQQTINIQPRKHDPSCDQPWRQHPSQSLPWIQPFQQDQKKDQSWNQHRSYNLQASSPEPAHTSTELPNLMHSPRSHTQTPQYYTKIMRALGIPLQQETSSPSLSGSGSVNQPSPQDRARSVPNQPSTANLCQQQLLQAQTNELNARMVANQKQIVDDWILKAENYFKGTGISPHLMVHSASLYFHGDALKWYESVQRIRSSYRLDEWSWPNFVRSVVGKFSPNDDSYKNQLTDSHEEAESSAEVELCDEVAECTNTRDDVSTALNLATSLVCGDCHTACTDTDNDEVVDEPASKSSPMTSSKPESLQFGHSSTSPTFHGSTCAKFTADVSIEYAPTSSSTSMIVCGATTRESLLANGVNDTLVPKSSNKAICVESQKNFITANNIVNQPSPFGESQHVVFTPAQNLKEGKVEGWDMFAAHDSGVSKSHRVIMTNLRDSKPRLKALRVVKVQKRIEKARKLRKDHKEKYKEQCSRSIEHDWFKNFILVASPGQKHVRKHTNHEMEEKSSMVGLNTFGVGGIQLLPFNQGKNRTIEAATVDHSTTKLHTAWVSPAHLL